MSVLSYVRLRCPLDEAMARYSGWIRAPEAVPRRLVREHEAVDLALANGEWVGLAVFVYASGGLAQRPVASWLELADGGDLVYAAYNDTVPYAQLVVVEQGRLMREFLKDEQDSSEDVNAGRLPEEAGRRLDTWIDGARWVEEDEEKLTRPVQGWLWIHRAA